MYYPGGKSLTLFITRLHDIMYRHQLKAGVPGGLVGYPRDYRNQFCEFNSHRVHTLAGTSSWIKKWSAESARAWVSNIRWKSTSSANAEPYARYKLKAHTGEEKGRHLWPRPVQQIPEGKTSYELSWKVKVMIKAKPNKIPEGSFVSLRKLNMVSSVIVFICGRTCYIANNVVCIVVCLNLIIVFLLLFFYVQRARRLSHAGNRVHRS